MRFSLRSLTWIFLLLFLAATALTGFGIYSTSIATIRSLVDERIAEVSLTAVPRPTGAEQNVRTGSRFDAVLIAQRLDALSRDRDTGDLGFSLTDMAGRHVAGNVRLSRMLPPGFSSVGVNDNIKGLTKGRALVRELPGGLRLTVTAETEPFNGYDRARARIYLIGFGSIIAVVLGGLVLFSRLVSRHITDMRTTVDRIIAGDMNERVPVTGDGSAFDQQADAFNRMLDRIQQLMEEIGNVSNDISHELRTPLTRLRGKLALLLSRVEEQEVMGAAVGGALEDADDLLAMFTAILRIAEIEGGERRRGFAPIDLAMLAGEVVAVMLPVAEESGHALLLEESGPLPISGDAQLLTQLLINLIENALRHTPPGTIVTIATSRFGERALMLIQDNGPGIAEDQRQKALRRFGRLQQGRSAGHGLGLPLAESIIRLHGGEMRLDDAAPGLTISMTLPTR
ncbi:MAG TPA: HAMP domain-containing sensor histidine kinase [Sphingobium sp.]